MAQPQVASEIVSQNEEETSRQREQEAEREHWWQVMRTLQHYLDFFECELSRRQRHLNKLNSTFAQRLPNMTYDKLSWLHQKAELNQEFLQDMVHYHSTHSFLEAPSFVYDEYDRRLALAQSKGEEFTEMVVPEKEFGPDVQIAEQHRNVAVLHSLYREWSAEGKAERNLSFAPILAQLEEHLPLSMLNKDGVKDYKRVLVPGCGLGRLPLEIAQRGYCCEGNEFSAYMAVASNFVLNGLQEREQYEIAPWVSNICNIVNVADTLETVMIPDVAAIDMLQGDELNDPNCPYPRFAMAAGDFVEIYGTPENKGAWDCIVTCFFIDTAPVVIEYIDVINHILKPGGIWINLGPLLYHWVADADNNQDQRFGESIELSYEELKHVISTFGIDIIHEEQRPCTYARCNTSMMHTAYNTVLFTAQKPLNSPTKPTK